jgi:hypothetical protein
MYGKGRHHLELISPFDKRGTVGNYRKECSDLLSSGLPVILPALELLCVKEAVQAFSWV